MVLQRLRSAFEEEQALLSILRTHVVVFDDIQGEIEKYIGKRVAQLLGQKREGHASLEKISLESVAHIIPERVANVHASMAQLMYFKKEHGTSFPLGKLEMHEVQALEDMVLQNMNDTTALEREMCAALESATVTVDQKTFLHLKNILLERKKEAVPEA